MRLFGLNDDARFRLKEFVNQSLRFTTSADVVMKASGLRYEAVCAIARERGVKIEDEDSKCIDEELLSRLADVHVSRLKSYFNNSRRHLSELSCAELTTFIDFCKTFKRRTANPSADLTWDIIDTDALREHFLQKVHSETPSFCDLFSGIGGVIFTVRPLTSDGESSSNLVKDAVVGRVIKCRVCCCGRPIVKRTCSGSRNAVIRQVALCARYHIYSADDNDYIFCDMRDIFFSINRAPGNAA